MGGPQKGGERGQDESKVNPVMVNVAVVTMTYCVDRMGCPLSQVQTAVVNMEPKLCVQRSEL